MQDFRSKSLQNDNKRSSRLLSKERYNPSKQGGEASFRVLYYGGAAGAVPFVWESQPGTPKHTFNDDPLPPLTPPPYYINPKPNNPLHKKNSKKSNIFFQSIFPKVHSKKINDSPSFSPSSSFSSSYSLPSTPFSSKKASKTRSRSGSSSSSNLAIRFGFDEEKYEPETNSPTSTLCFGPRNGRRVAKSYYLYPIKSVKNVVLSMVGHATAK